MPVPFLKRYGHKLLDLGYEVLGITPGTKHPTYNYSVKALPEITHEIVDGWLSNGHARDGVGIRSRFTPMLDIDCKWEPLVAEIRAEAEDKIGYAPLRTGQPPKLGMIYRSRVPFKKVQSKAFIDPNGNKAQLEVIGEGLQWVAYGGHPDTKKDYFWNEEGYEIRFIKQRDLVEITQEDAINICRFFNERCTELGWKLLSSDKQSTALTTLTARSPDDIGGVTNLGLSIDEVRRWVEKLPNGDNVEYEDSFIVDPSVPNYRNVIFAIWHETEGSAEGREIALEWSESNSKHDVEKGRFRKLWNSSNDKDMDHPVTFRYVIGCVLAIEEEAKRELLENYLAELTTITDHFDLKKQCDVIAKTHFDDMAFERLAQALKAAFLRVNSVPLPIGTARKILRHTPSQDDLPAWVVPWKYIMHSKMFYNHETGQEISREAFDMAFSKYLGGASAVDFAQNKAQIPFYSMQMYAPSEDEEFTFQKMSCINTFSDRMMPAMPEKYDRRDRECIQIVKRHFAHMLPDERERAFFISWLAYIVQTRERPNWCIVLIGVDGDGKSFFAEMMGAVLGGVPNIRRLDAQQLEDKYTGWSVGQLLCVIEELRMQGHNRFDVLNKIKPYITNDAINVHPKNVNPYTALNTTAYLAFSNHGDALPITENDRRYLVLNSQYQTAEKLAAFISTHKTYFQDLFSTIKGPGARTGAIRKWLMNYELHPEFLPKERAPITESRQKMIDLSKSAAQIALEEVIKEDTHPQISHDFIVSGALTQYLFEEVQETVNTYAVSRLMSFFGYDRLPHRVRIEVGVDKKDSIWVKEPSKFKADKMSSLEHDIRRFLAKRQRYLNHKDEL